MVVLDFYKYLLITIGVQG